ncbi:hypothetical protein Q7C_1999 [Methylophaga frappieri]|uniref:DUF447 family protein n=1 Tax=Methylophaga frappieri (strain ATCC BAA-2434 / DSM 25690 / JAM7) TaxID=754477 RepID=I1YJP6_METFJ|nr:DUF447 domain-containing protein [Methylophaga frappieri]AFJ03139.1 hypothetical protein Q7C_1999 [Methylophaga frappieri]
MARLTAKIHEVIVTTQNADGSAHHAPMGISEVNGHFQIKPFKPSTTYDNLQRQRTCSINYTDDVRVFAGALTGHREWPASRCEKVDGLYLTDALSHSEIRIKTIDDDDPRACFHGEVIFEQQHGFFRGYNRAQSAVIEAAILVSRLSMLPEQKIRDELAYLTIGMEKTAGEREWQAWGWLMDKVKQAGIHVD